MLELRHYLDRNMVAVCWTVLGLILAVCAVSVVGDALTQASDALVASLKP